MKTLFALTLAALLVTMIGCRDDTSSVRDGRGAMLTLTKPSDVTIARGQMAEVEIKINRDNFEGPVAISFERLPYGVSIVDPDMQIVGNEGTYRLRAAENADLVSGYQATVTAQGPDGTAVTKEFMIEVSR